MDKQKAIEVLNKAPDGWEFCSEIHNRFYRVESYVWLVFLSGEWEPWHNPISFKKLSLLHVEQVKIIACEI